MSQDTLHDSIMKAALAKCAAMLKSMDDRDAAETARRAEAAADPPREVLPASRTEPDGGLAV